MKFVTDSSTLYTRNRLLPKGVVSCPLRVNINGKSYIDMEELTADELLDLIKDGGIPATSQPPIGEKIEAYNAQTRDGSHVIDIAMADGLSGTYQTGVMAKGLCDHPERVDVFNTGTLCGPHRALLKKALEMNENGRSREEILAMLEKSSATDTSFLIPFDFGFLKRGGRVRGIEAGIGNLLKLIPVMIKTEDGMHLEKFAVTRTLKKAFTSIAEEFKKRGVDENYVIYVTHANNQEACSKAEEIMKTYFPRTKVIDYPLSPAFITQGGPGCVAIQTISIQE